MTNGSRAPRGDSYDAIVIGSGIGGISAAAMLARAGMNTLVVERLDRPGGYAAAFQRGQYIFDPAIHWAAQCGPNGLFDLVLKYLGVRDLCTFLPIGGAYTAYLPDGSSYRLPLGVDEFIEAHVQYFPEHAEAAREFFTVCLRMHKDVHQLSMSLDLKNLDEAVARFPAFFRYRTATLQDVLDEYVSDPQLQKLCAMTWPFSGPPPEKQSFFQFAQVLMNELEGSYFVQGSFGELPAAMAAAVEKHGGEMLYETAVSKITVEDGKVTGVVLEDGTPIKAPVVISNADAFETFDRMVGEEHLPAQFMRRLRRMKPAESAFVLFVATDLDLRQFNPEHETLVTLTDATPEDDLAQARPTGVWICVPTIIDPSLAPPGEHLAIISAIARYDIGEPWQNRRDAYAEALLDHAEAIFPGIRRHITFQEAATPETLQRYTLNTGGSMYGWENTPQQTGTKRPAHQTPIGGLYLSGHWTQPGGGSIRCVSSGVHTAHIVMTDLGRADAIPPFYEADLPGLG